MCDAKDDRSDLTDKSPAKRSPGRRTRLKFTGGVVPAPERADWRTSSEDRQEATIAALAKLLHQLAIRRKEPTEEKE